jgi:hypothetical protein
MKRNGSSRNGIRVALNSERGIVVSGVPGWSDVEFSRLAVALINGAPALTGFSLDPVAGAPVTRLTAKRLATIPAALLAQLAAEFLVQRTDAPAPNAVFERMRELATRFEIPERPRGAKGDELAEFHRAILRLIEIAHAEGRSAIGLIQERTGKGYDRCKQFSREAQNWAKTTTGAVSAALPRPLDNTTQPIDPQPVTIRDTREQPGRVPGPGSTREAQR